ncbi:MAG: hypothetical protein HRU20_21265 [Pseudomonadales bacterium]|nr:hypothetical protein [Pseudomonadales bacterium]
MSDDRRRNAACAGVLIVAVGLFIALHCGFPWQAWQPIATIVAGCIVGYFAKMTIYEANNRHYKEMESNEEMRTEVDRQHKESLADSREVLSESYRQAKFLELHARIMHRMDLYYRERSENKEAVDEMERYARSLELKYIMAEDNDSANRIDVYRLQITEKIKEGRNKLSDHNKQYVINLNKANISDIEVSGFPVEGYELVKV